jgi:hypothetical protein
MPEERGQGLLAMKHLKASAVLCIARSNSVERDLRIEPVPSDVIGWALRTMVSATV